MSIEWLIIWGFIEVIIYWGISKYAPWLPLIPIFFLYILPTLWLIYIADMPWGDKIIIMAYRLAGNAISGIGAAIAEFFIKTREGYR